MQDEPPAVGDLLDDLVRDYEENGKSLGWCKIAADIHLRPAFGKLPVSKLSPAAVRGALPDYRRPVATFGYYTGCRKGEVLSLEWPQVDLTARIVRLEVGTTKNDEGRVIRLASELYQTLSIQKETRDQQYPECPWVSHNEGQRIHGFARAWKTARRTAGVGTGGRNLIRAGVPETVAMRISGHKTRSMLDRHNIVTETDLKDAVRKLGEYILGRETADKEQAESHASGKSRTIVAQAKKRESVQ